MGNQSEISSEAFSARELPKKRSRSRSVLIVGQGTESWLLIVPAHSTPRDAADAATTTSIPVVTPSLARPRVDARPASSASSAEGGDQRDTCANKRSLPHYSDELNNEFSRSKRSSDASIGMTFASACTASDVVGHRITVDAADVLVIAAADASERDLVARAERASVHLRKLRPNDLVTVVEQPSRPRTFVPPGYGLPLTQEVAAKMGATVHSMTRDASQLASHDGGAKARGCVVPARSLPNRFSPRFFPESYRRIYLDPKSAPFVGEPSTNRPIGRSDGRALDFPTTRPSLSPVRFQTPIQRRVGHDPSESTHGRHRGRRRGSPRRETRGKEARAGRGRRARGRRGRRRRRLEPASATRAIRAVLTVHFRRRGVEGPRDRASGVLEVARVHGHAGDELEQPRREEMVEGVRVVAASARVEVHRAESQRRCGRKPFEPVRGDVELGVEGGMAARGGRGGGPRVRVTHPNVIS